jgi:Cu-processing system permease protein
MTATLAIARYELLIVRRNLWVAIAVGLMSLFAVVLTIAGSAAAGALGVDRLTVTVTSLTTLSVYLVPLIALLLSFDAIAGELERGTLALSLSYPISKAAFLIGKFIAHLITLAAALGIGYGTAGLLSAWLGSTSTESLTALVTLFASATLLGAAFLGLGYAVSGTVRQPGAAAGLVIGLWLVGVVLYDIGLLGALVADGGGAFTTKVFPWLLVANPADAFRIVNLAGSEAAALASGFSSTQDALPTWAPLLAMALWPPAILTVAWRLFRRIEA